MFPNSEFCILNWEFTIKDAKGKKCIQYTDKRGGNTRYYALKVFDTAKVNFMVSLYLYWRVYFM